MKASDDSAGMVAGAPSAEGATAISPAADAATTDWAVLSEAAPVETWCAAWLRIQSERLGGVTRGVVRRRSSPDVDPLTLATLAADDEIALASQVAASFDEGTGLAAPIGGGTDRFGVSWFGRLGGDSSVVVAVEVERDDEAALTEVMRQLQWGAGWLERRLGGAAGDGFGGAAGPAQAVALLDLLALALEAGSFAEASHSVVAQLARLLVCDRVSFGVETGGGIRLEAMSHTAAFGREMNLVRAIEAAMDEAVDQNAVLVHPAERQDAPLVVRAQTAIAEAGGARSVLTVPVGRGEGLRGALLFEHPEPHYFTPDRVVALESIGIAVAPILDLWRREDRSLWKKARDAARTQLSRLVGPGYLGRKVALAVVAVLALFFAFAHGDYRVGADGVLEGASRRVVIAPFDGFVATADRRAGDFVEQDDVLASLDDRELELERLKWASRLVQLRRQSDESRAARDYGRTGVLGAQIDEAEAEVARLEERLARTRVTAPFAGLLVSGDLSQSLGAAVNRGDVLFEIAPLERYRVLLEVDEEQIADVSLGQQGTLLLAAMPNASLPFEVTKVTPVATAEDGRNFFRVEGTLADASPALRPGMEGVGKIEVDRRRLLWIWTRSFRSWLRLWVWSWWP